MDNIYWGPDAQVRWQIASMKQMQASGRLEKNSEPVPNVVFDVDSEANVAVKYSSSKDNIIKIDSRVGSGQRPAWIALHFKIGTVELGHAAAIGFVCRSRAPRATLTKPCLRSGTSSGFVDNFFPKMMVSFAKESTHIDVIDIAANSNIPRDKTWHEFILFFEKISFETDILDMRFFIV